MTIPHNMHLRNFEYRSYSLQISRSAHQWEIEIDAARADLPELELEKRVVRGWDQDEVIKRAKSRVDDLLEGRHSN